MITIQDHIRSSVEKVIAQTGKVPDALHLDADAFYKCRDAGLIYDQNNAYYVILDNLKMRVTHA